MRAAVSRGQYHISRLTMRTSVAVALCLFGLTVAAEDKSTRKSRQALQPFVPLFHDSPNVYSLVHQPAHYSPSAVHSPAFPHSSFHSTGPQVFHHNSHLLLPVSSNYHHQEYSQSGRQQNGFRTPSENSQNEQLGEYESSPRASFQQSIESPNRPLIAPSQGNAEQNFPSGTPQFQDLRESADFGQSPAGQSAYRPSPRLYGPSQATVHYPANSQPSSQPQQQTGAFFSGTFDQQSSSPAQASQQGAPTPILSQSGQTRNDGSYNYGPAQASQQGAPVPILSQYREIRPDGSYRFEFHSADGIHRSEIGEIRPGHYRNDGGEYN